MCFKARPVDRHCRGDIGDTGSAAIAACRDRDSIEIFICTPMAGCRQMTTVAAANVHNIALEGSFDDAQDAVKAMFGDLDFRDAHRLGAVNSINWAWIMAPPSTFGRP